MAAVIVYSDFEAQENKTSYCFHFGPVVKAATPLHGASH